ncbi:Zeaxanthin epoxidase [Carex littledalei]|uniref:Zeaxanthin epoxidase n=1 Tax=Carex littledalei TaxID=544730 RepID=A0A833VWP2_9POAL|nr:Zeaxanthin epoxidase [Carex littledalei]
MLESNALSTLEAIDIKVATQVMDAGCIIGNRVNGIVDGLSGCWFAKFDTFSTAAEQGQPVARVISRITLQQILARALGDDAILINSNVVDFFDRGNKVCFKNGQQLDCDLLVGGDGISSKVRKILFRAKDSTYSGYTCYTGITDYVPPHIGTVG